MTIEIKHSTQATGTDAGNGEIHKAQWNEAHAITLASGNLLGRSTAGAGAAEEIAVGTGLSLSGGVLAATGGGGSSTLTIQNKTAAYTVVAGDLGTIINCTSGTFTVSLTAAATLGAGFNVTVWNTSETTDDAITIDPASTETIDGLTTLILRRGEGMQIVCDGTNWQTSDKKVMRGYAENVAAANARPIASGNGSFALGYGASATGDLGAAFGPNATASAVRTLGFHGEATSDNSSAVGYNSAVQRARTVTGSGAMALGGSYASGTDSFAAAVANNTSSYGATGTGSIVIGDKAKATSSRSIAIGYLATTSSNGSVALGYGAYATQSYSAAIGRGAASTVVGKLAYSGSFFSSDGFGSSQYGLVVMVGATTSATPVLLTTDAGAASALNQIILQNKSACSFTGIIVARQQSAGGTQSAAWEVKGLIRREGLASTTVLVSSTLTAIDNQPGWVITLSADTANGGLAVTATGAASTNIRWVATIQTSEITYA